MIRIIAAVASNGVIGKDGSLPWGRSYPEDLKRFKNLTSADPDSTLLVGRETFKSMGVLANRRIAVLSRRGFHAKGAHVYSSLEEALDAEQGDIWVGGGRPVYEATMPLAHELYITHIHEPYEGDTYFPSIGRDWKVHNEEVHENLTFTTYTRNSQ